MKIEKLCINCMQERRSPDGICEFCGFDVRTFELPRHHMRPFTILAGKYLIGNAIGEGGFGITYIGMDLNLEVKVAIKEYYPQGAAVRDCRTNDSTVWSYSKSTQVFFEEGREKFINEAKTIAKFRNVPEIVGVIEFFRENQTAYIVMEYLDGQTLKQYLKANGGKIPAEELLRMMKPLISSLGKVHSQGLIHRDISPDNIMLMKDRSIKILDFGGARDFISQSGKSLSVMVKHGYAPEEQYRSHGDQGPWTDVYALCATMYRCITGKIPPEALDRLYEDELKPISSFNVDCPKYIEEAILKGLSVRKNGRYQSMEELHDAIYKEQEKLEKKHKEKISSIESEHSEYIEHAIDRGLNVYADELCDTLRKEQIDQGLNAYADKLYEDLRKEQRKPEKVHKSNETDTKKKESKGNVNKKNEEKKIIIAATVIAVIGIAVIAGVGIKMKQPDEKVVATPTPSAKDEIKATATSTPKTDPIPESIKTKNDINIIKKDEVYYALGSVNVYADCKLSEVSMGTVQIGQKLISTGVSEDGKWIEVEIDGQIGYVRAEWTSKTIPENITDISTGTDRKKSYYLSVSDGEGSGYYAQGEKAEISTDIINSYFPVWAIKEETGLIKDIYSGKTTFIMPDSNAYVHSYSQNGIKVENDSLLDKSGDFIIKVDGEDYTLPVSVQEFESKGWKCDFGNNKNIEDYPGYYLAGQAQSDSEKIEIIGKIDTNKQINIVGMRFWNTGVQVELPGEVFNGKSTRTEIKDMYGKSNKDESTLSYYISENVTIEFSFEEKQEGINDGIVEVITVRKIPEDYISPEH